MHSVKIDVFELIIETDIEKFSYWLGVIMFILNYISNNSVVALCPSGLLGSDYHFSLHNNPKKSGSQLLYDGRLKSWIKQSTQ
jgi:hypothetical protein